MECWVDFDMDAHIIDMIGWLGFILILLGYYFNARKKIYCFYIWGLGNVVYVIYGFIINAFPMMAMSAFVLIMNVYGYLSWVKDFR